MIDVPTEASALFAMTELETVLKGGDARQAAAAILSRFDDLAQGIAAHQRSGPSPSEYSRMDAIGNAIAAARDIVIAVSPAK
jgi:hypothetical protein